jgi:hypothetical protein
MTKAPFLMEEWKKPMSNISCQFVLLCLSYRLWRAFEKSRVCRTLFTHHRRLLPALRSCFSNVGLFQPPLRLLPHSFFSSFPFLSWYLIAVLSFVGCWVVVVHPSFVGRAYFSFRLSPSYFSTLPFPIPLPSLREGERESGKEGVRENRQTEGRLCTFVCLSLSLSLSLFCLHQPNDLMWEERETKNRCQAEQMKKQGIT